MNKEEKRRFRLAKRSRFFCNFFESIGYYAAMRVRRSKNINYFREKYADGQRSSVDFLVPKNAKNAPLLIYVHGGGFICGKMRNRTAYCQSYAEKGYVCANIDYDLAPENIFPHQLHQLATALDYIYTKKDEYSFDPQRTVIAGESAGSYFTVYLAQLCCGDYYKDKLQINSIYAKQFKIITTVLISGAVDVFDMCDNRFHNIQLFIECFTNKTIAELKACKDDDMIKMLAPTRRLDDTFPPCVIIKSKRDKLRTESDSIAKKLTENGVENLLILADGIISCHGFAICTRLKKGRLCFEKTIEFIDAREKSIKK